MRDLFKTVNEGVHLELEVNMQRMLIKADKRLHQSAADASIGVYCCLMIVISSDDPPVRPRLYVTVGRRVPLPP